MRFRRRDEARDEPEPDPESGPDTSPGLHDAGEADSEAASPDGDAGSPPPVEPPDEPEVPTPAGGVEIPPGARSEAATGRERPTRQPEPAPPPVRPSPPEVSRVWDVSVGKGDGTVRAAGGLVWTRWRGELRVLLVHRPRYDDWSLPKGKASPGESDADCALREVREETGLACSLGEELATTGYRDRHNRPKTVRWFAMQPLGGSPEPHSEVDEVRWLAPQEAKGLCTYERDAEMIDALIDHLARDEGGGEAAAPG